MSQIIGLLGNLVRAWNEAKTWQAKHSVYSRWY